MTSPNMEAKFKRECSFGKERFRGLVRWTKANGITTRVYCEKTQANKELALDAARRLVTALIKREWTTEGASR